MMIDAGTIQARKWLSPPFFFDKALKWAPWCLLTGMVIFIAALWWALFKSPPDYLQGESVRIMYLHVPSAWMSLFLYVVMAGCSACGLIFRLKIGFYLSAACAPIGAAFTLAALVTGSIWGKPTWGAWWVWDARLTTELILFFLYLGYIGVRSAVDDQNKADRLAAVVALVGLINIPIIHFSVHFWNTLHQGASVFRMDGPSIAISMLIPLLLMTLAYMILSLAACLESTCCEIMRREHGRRWLQSRLDMH